MLHFNLESMTFGLCKYTTAKIQDLINPLSYNEHSEKFYKKSISKILKF